jgi:hypothetical protein
MAQQPQAPGVARLLFFMIIAVAEAAAVDIKVVVVALSATVGMGPTYLTSLLVLPLEAEAALLLLSHRLLQLISRLLLFVVLAHPVLCRVEDMVLMAPWLFSIARPLVHLAPLVSSVHRMAFLIAPSARRNFTVTKTAPSLRSAVRAVDFAQKVQEILQSVPKECGAPRRQMCPFLVVRAPSARFLLLSQLPALRGPMAPLFPR